MTVDVEERIRASLREVARVVDYADDRVIVFAPERSRRPLRAVVVAGLAAAAVAGIALAVGSSASHRATPATGFTPPSTTDEATTTTLVAPADPTTRAALARWSHFPAAADPRPIVLIGEPVDGPAHGFTNPDIAIADAEKEAFDAGAMSPPPSYPAGPPAVQGVPIIGASEAFDRLRATGTGSASTTLEATDVRLGTGSFRTDRGTQTLPAWLFSFRDVEDPVAVLAVGPSDLFTNPNGITPSTQLGATAVGPRTVELTFVGPRDDTGPCGALYEAYVSESSVAVAIAVSVVQSQPAPTSAPTSAGVIDGCVDIGYERHVTITLQEPLGDRVLVDAKTNSAVAVGS